jgi:hypothetical protein
MVDAPDKSFFFKYEIRIVYTHFIGYLVVIKGNNSFIQGNIFLLLNNALTTLQNKCTTSGSKRAKPLMYFQNNVGPKVEP